MPASVTDKLEDELIRITESRRLAATEAGAALWLAQRQEEGGMF